MKPDKNKSFNKKDFIVILILIVMVVGVILTFYNNNSKPENWKYNTLVENVEGDYILLFIFRKLIFLTLLYMVNYDIFHYNLIQIQPQIY